MSRARNRQDLAGQQDQVYPAALRYLERRDYAEQELREKLLARGAAPEAVDACVERLYAAGYLDQQRFACSRARRRRDAAAWGRGLVRLELLQLGVDKEQVRAALDAEYGEEAERQAAAAIISRELGRLPAGAAPEQRNRALAALQRRLLQRGFQAGLVYELLANAQERR